MDGVNNSSQGGEVEGVARSHGQRPASFNPDKLIGSRKGGEGTLWPRKPPPSPSTAPLSKEKGGVGVCVQPA